jgi:hypothetical protein
LSIRDYYIFNVKSLSLLIINSSNILNFNTSSYIIISTSYSTVITLRYSIKIAYLDSLSIIAKIMSSFFLIKGSFNRGNLVIKFIVIIYYFLFKALLG